MSVQIAHLRLSSSKSERHELITWPLHLDLFQRQLLARIECGKFLLDVLHGGKNFFGLS